MEDLNRIVKLTKEQYATLAAGGTVGEYTGLDSSYIYLVKDDTEYIPIISLEVTEESTIELSELYSLLAQDYGNFVYLRVNKPWLSQILDTKYYTLVIPDTSNTLMFVSMNRVGVSSEEPSEELSEEPSEEYKYNIYIKPVYSHYEGGYFYWFGDNLYGYKKLVDILKDDWHLYFKVHKQDDWPGIEELDLRNMTGTDPIN